MLSPAEGGCCFLRKHLCELRESLGLYQLPKGRVPDLHCPPPGASSLNRSQPGWKGTEGVVPILSSGPILHLNPTYLLLEVSVTD